MLSRRDNVSPVDYSLCTDTVTVYHRDAPNDITRTVITRAFFDERKNHNVDKTGSSEVNGFLLVVPGSTQACHVGDKVVRGVGIDCTTDADWHGLIPTKVAGCAVVKYVDCKYWHGKMTHTEAGG